MTRYDQKPLGGELLDYGCPVGLDDLLAYWPFNEGSGNVYDLSGNNYVGTLTNGATWDAGPTDNVINFNGIDQYIATTCYPPTGNSPRTIMAYIKSDGVGDDSFFDYGIAANGRSFFWSVEDVGGSKYVLFRHFGGNIRFPCPDLGTWFHVAAVVPDGATTTDDVLCYINGVVTPGTRNAGADQVLDTGSDDLWFGKDSHSGGGYFTGQIAYVYAWKRDLSASEIASVCRNHFIMVGRRRRIIYDEIAAVASDIPIFAHHYKMLKAG